MQITMPTSFQRPGGRRRKGTEKGKGEREGDRRKGKGKGKGEGEREEKKSSATDWVNVAEAWKLWT